MLQPSPLNLSGDRSRPDASPPSSGTTTEDKMILSPSERETSNGSVGATGADTSTVMSLLQHSQLHQLFQHHNGLNALVQQQQMNELIRSQLGALQDRLQLNIAQQTQLVTQLAHSSDRKLNNGMQLQIQQLVIEQQQLIQQIQLQQRHYLVQQGLSPGISHGDLQKLWQDSLLMDSSSSAKLLSLLSNPLFATALSTGDSRAPDSSQNAKISSHPLYQNGTCMWLSCETPCDSYFAFLQHLSSFHPPDDKASAQLKVQVQILEHLEKQVEQERVRLQAMQSHLQMKQSPDTTTPGTDRAPPVRHASTSNIDISATSPPQSTLSPMPLNELRVSTPTAGSIVAGTSSRTSVNGSNPQPRKRLPDKSTLPIAADIARNREFYKSTDVRPPYTYASLIRQAIMDSDEKQLTLNEIYNWFQDTFAYFRRNAATWKNAVRHNLSLHKCFMRVENVKGAVWTVDEAEFYRRRPQRLTSSTCGPYRQQPPAEVSRHRSLSAFIDHAMNNGTNDGSTTTNGMQFPERSSSSHTPDFSSSRLTDPDEYDAFIKEEYGGHYSPSTKLSRSSQDHKTSNGHPQGLEPEGKFPGEVPRGTYPGGIPAGLLMTNGFYDSAAAGLLAATAAAAAVSLPNTVIVTPGRGQSPGPEEGGLVIAEDQPPTRPLPNDLGDGDDDSTPPTVKREASSHQSN